MDATAAPSIRLHWAPTPSTPLPTSLFVPSPRPGRKAPKAGIKGHDLWLGETDAPRPYCLPGVGKLGRNSSLPNTATPMASFSRPCCRAHFFPFSDAQPLKAHNRLGELRLVTLFTSGRSATNSIPGNVPPSRFFGNKPQ